MLESIGGDSLGAAFRALRPGGQLIWFGQVSRTPARLDFFAHFGQAGATIRHFHYETDPPAEDLATLVRLVATGRLHPELGFVAGWSRTATALAELRDRRIRGNAVLTIEEPLT